MWELLFIIVMSDDHIVKEVWEDPRYSTMQECENEGMELAYSLVDQISDKYPKMVSFDLECRTETF